MTARKSREERLRLWRAERVVDRMHGMDRKVFLAIRIDEMTALSSPVSSIRSALATRPPSLISWRVRSRRFTCHARVSCRARFA